MTARCGSAGVRFSMSVDLEPGPRVTMHCWATQECPAPAAPNCFAHNHCLCAGQQWPLTSWVIQSNEVERERSVFSFPNLNLVSITSSPDHQGSCCWMARAERETLPKRPKLRLKLVRRVGGHLSGLVEEMVTGLPSARKKILCNCGL